MTEHGSHTPLQRWCKRRNTTPITKRRRDVSANTCAQIKRGVTHWSEGATTDGRAGYSAGPTPWTPRHRPARRQSQLINPSPRPASGLNQTSAATSPLGRLVQTTDKSAGVVSAGSSPERHGQTSQTFDYMAARHRRQCRRPRHHPLNGGDCKYVQGRA